jgi:hypothetical protein
VGGMLLLKNATAHVTPPTTTPRSAQKTDLCILSFTMGRRRAHYRRLISQGNGCFSQPPTTTTRLAQKTDLRTPPLLLEGVVRTNMGWLDKITGVFRRHPLPPPRSAQDANLRTVPPMGKRLAHMSGWWLVRQGVGCFSNPPTPPPDLRRGLNCAP